jgi:phenylacetic acid degradation operon negative regulatory protein
VSHILDDMDSRPGSTTSLIRTVIGLYLRRAGGWISIAHLIEVMEQLDVSAPLTRTAVVRLKKKGLLVPHSRDKVSGYALAPEAATMLGKGDRRIFSARHMQPDDPWCVISFSLPEELRHVRHQLRRRLYWIGGGMISPALWICPDFLADEVEDILNDLDIRRHATLLRTERPRVAGELSDAIAEWWDLTALQTLHREVAAELSALLADGTAETDAVAFARYIRGVDTWRIIPYIDPGLPSDLLPINWPGEETTALFSAISTTYADAGWHYVRAVLGVEEETP